MFEKLPLFRSSPPNQLFKSFLWLIEPGKFFPVIYTSNLYKYPAYSWENQLFLRVCVNGTKTCEKTLFRSSGSTVVAILLIAILFPAVFWRHAVIVETLTPRKNDHGRVLEISTFHGHSFACCFCNNSIIWAIKLKPWIQGKVTLEEFWKSWHFMAIVLHACSYESGRTSHF